MGIHAKSSAGVMLAGMGFTVFVLLVFVMLSWLNMPTGRFSDWIVGILSFWWLLVIVTVPWNVYFRAHEVLLEGARSRQHGIAIKAADETYLRVLARRALTAALALHGISVVGLYLVAAANISDVGFFAAGAALLLTGLRPAGRAHEYIVVRLTQISQDFSYPREDVERLRQRVTTLEDQVKQVHQRLDPDDPTSWAAVQQKNWQATQDELTRAQVTLEETRVQNQAAHTQLTREMQHAVAQITEDGRVLEHVREIIRFFKTT